VISVAIEPKTKADQDKLSIALQKLSEEDPTFRVHSDAETAQTIISGMGELHLEVLVERMKREFKVDANVGRPQVPTARRCVSASSTWRGSSSARRAAAASTDTWSSIWSRASRHGLRVRDNIVGARSRGSTSARWSRGQGSARKRRARWLPDGRREVELVDGSYHDVDSSEMAFKIAGSMAVKEAARQAHPVLLEPIMDVEVVTPADYMGERHRRPLGPAARSADDAARRRARRRRQRAALRDVRLLDHAAVDEARAARFIACSSVTIRKCRKPKQKRLSRK